MGGSTLPLATPTSDSDRCGQWDMQTEMHASDGAVHRKKFLCASHFSGPLTS